ncbi:biotin--[acetyl-CoA-carboxylase] ligase [Pseudoramibacter alactolyticus]|uniref:biotin--[acetyl-CoA-carboxylase] ligase n=1 Tax=Pseudoramibacter alactolyticus TaxID=113287 RepID=UPI0028E82C52|nr:biotin--[acetyl-CoA-carboxylase] ligase [Pseudoramibacter alactolyticus]
MTIFPEIFENTRSLAPSPPFLDDGTPVDRLFWFGQLPSTNGFLKQHALRLPHGTIVVADAQSAGRGRRGRDFFSPPNGGLHLSVLYRPAKRSALSSFVTMGACVAAARAIADASGRYPDIKWVNDLYRGGRKIAGILTEAGLGHDDPTADFIVVGIEVNLFRPTKGFPTAIAGRAGAVSDDAPPPSGDSPLKLRLLAALIRELTALGEAAGAKAYIGDYRAHSMLIGKRVRLSGRSFQSEGTVRGFNGLGHLLLADAAAGNKPSHLEEFH